MLMALFLSEGVPQCRLQRLCYSEQACTWKVS